MKCNWKLTVSLNFEPNVINMQNNCYDDLTVSSFKMISFWSNEKIDSINNYVYENFPSIICSFIALILESYVLIYYEIQN